MHACMRVWAPSLLHYYLSNTVHAKETANCHTRDPMAPGAQTGPATLRLALSRMLAQTSSPDGPSTHDGTPALWTLRQMRNATLSPPPNPLVEASKQNIQSAPSPSPCTHNVTTWHTHTHTREARGCARTPHCQYREFACSLARPASATSPPATSPAAARPSRYPSISCTAPSDVSPL